MKVAGEAPAEPPLPWPPLQLQLACMACGGGIDQQHPGYAAVNVGAALVRTRQQAAWRRAHPGGDAARHGPPPIPWRIVHEACDEPATHTMTIAASKLRTGKRLMGQTWRLWSKPWSGGTNWPEFARGLLATAAATDDDQAAAARAAAAKRAAHQADSGADG